MRVHRVLPLLVSVCLPSACTLVAPDGGDGPTIVNVFPTTLSTTESTQVRVLGSGFGAADLPLQLGDQNVTSFEVIDDGHLEVEAPASSLGASELVVSSAGKMSRAPIWY